MTLLLLIAAPAAAQPAPGIWSYTHQDGLHKATVADLAGFFQVQCKGGSVSLVALINSEVPPPPGDSEAAQLRFEDLAVPVLLERQPQYSGSRGGIHTEVFLLSVQGRGPEILAAIKRAYSFALDRGESVAAFSAKGSTAALSQMERNCAAR